MSNKLSDSYTKFCALVAAVRALPTTPKMTPTEEMVLNKLIVRWGNGERVSVVGFMVNCGDFSPTTVHRVVSRLKKIGLVSTIEDVQDGRSKYISPTKQCEKYLVQMGKAMSAAVQA